MESVKTGFTQLVEEGAGALKVAQSGDVHYSEKLKAGLKVLAKLFFFLVKVYTILFNAVSWCYSTIKAYPKGDQLITMIFAVVLCFYGGIYIVSLAALEALVRMGGTRLWDDLVYVWKVCMQVGEKVLKDGESFNQEMMYQAMVKIEQPARLQTAMGNLWSAYVAVLATLSLQFAQVVAIALGMAACIMPTTLKLVRPPITSVLAHESWSLHHWMDDHKSPDGKWLDEYEKDKEEGDSVFVSTIVNFAVMWLAWTLYAFVAAFYSALKGGRMFADALLGKGGLVPSLLSEWECMAEGSLVAKLLGPTGHADEVVMYLLAGVGVYMQVAGGFSVAFPLNIVLMPLSLIEWFLRYQVTFGSTPGAAPSG